MEFMLLELLDSLNTSENLDSDYWLYLEWDLESASDDNVENVNSGFKNVKSNRGNADQSFVSFLAKFNSILDLHAPLKKISKQKLKFRNKPWITLGLQKSISIKNHLLTKYIKLKDVTLKNEAQIKYKQYRNLLSTLMKESIYYILFHKLFPKQPK